VLGLDGNFDLANEGFNDPNRVGVDYGHRLMRMYKDVSNSDG